MSDAKDLTSAVGQPIAPTPPASVATGDLIPGATTDGRRQDNRSTAEADARWIRKAEHWGEWIRYSDTEPAPPESIWMLRGATGRVRFYAKGKGQVGDEHNSVVSAAYWAWMNRWLWTDADGSLDILAQLECRAWCEAGGADAEMHNDRIETGVRA